MRLTYINCALYNLFNYILKCCLIVAYMFHLRFIYFLNAFVSIYECAYIHMCTHVWDVCEEYLFICACLSANGCIYDYLLMLMCVCIYIYMCVKVFMFMYVIC